MTDIEFEKKCKEPIDLEMFYSMISASRSMGLLKWLVEHFNTPENDVVKILREELFIPSMTSEIAWQAICWTKVDATNRNCKNLVSVIRNCIMMSGVFYTNVSEDVRNRLQSEGTLDVATS